MSLTQKYHAFIKANHYISDSYQLTLIALLENFLETLACPSIFTKQSWIKKLFKKDTDPAPMGVYIYGGVGRGKTMIMNLFYDFVPLTRKKRVHFHTFMKDVHERLAYFRAHHDQDPILLMAKEISEKIDFLCFDELYITDIADAMVIARLFEAMMKYDIRFIMTSNRPPKDLYQNGLNRGLFLPFIDLLETHFIIETLDHPTDYRLKEKSLETYYHFPLGEESEKHVKNLWFYLTDNADPQPVDILVMGRQLHFKKTYNQLLQTSFDQLCKTALGTKDYIKICDVFQVIIVNNIPQMSANMRNEATRFRNFIDIAYEAGKIIYFTAACPVEILYDPEADYAFEFQRTISRLREMTTQEYIEKNHPSKKSD